jgi:hypothetical protein
VKSSRIRAVIKEKEGWAKFSAITVVLGVVEVVIACTLRNVMSIEDYGGVDFRNQTH